jgi:putative membrane protein
VTVGGLQALVVILALFCAWHAWTALGPRLAAAFLVITLVTSWTLEELGVATGLVYGQYHYTQALGPSIGSVPLLIPLAWFALAYPTSVLVDLVADRWVGGWTGGPRRLVALAAAGALLMAAWDIALDPILSGPTYRAWVWEAGGTAGAVPAENYAGWFVTAFTIFLAFRLVQRRVSSAGIASGLGEGVGSEPGESAGPRPGTQRVPERGAPAVTAPAPARP